MAYYLPILANMGPFNTDSFLFIGDIFDDHTRNLLQMFGAGRQFAS